jgi:hypothetical protein
MTHPELNIALAREWQADLARLAAKKRAARRPSAPETRLARSPRLRTSIVALGYRGRGT